MLLLQQREAGYLCSYQLQPQDDGTWLGTWLDSRDRKGTVRLTRLSTGVTVDGLRSTR